MGDPTELSFTPATVLAERIRRRTLSPVDLLDAVLARVEAVDPTVHAFVTLDVERARAAARAAEAALTRGERLGPLHGIPVSIKDLEPTAGLRTTYGSKFFEQNVPEVDGAVAGRLRAAGAIVFGKTNTPHFGHKDMCDNLVMEATRNPWKLDRTSGASSGGAGAAVASGLGPIAHGSDGAGSIRIPAALCGIFGLKPSFGLVPYWPNPDFWAARSHNGPMARTVRDAALMLDAIAGPDPRDPTTIGGPVEDHLAACDGGVRDRRVAWSADFGYAAVDPEVRRATEAAARRFEELGCQVEAVDPGWDDPGPWHAVLYQASISARNADRAAERPDWIEPARQLDRPEQGPARPDGLLRAGPALHGRVRPAADAADALRGMVVPARAERDRRPADADDVRPAAVHLPLQPDRLAGRVGAVRLQLGRIADRAPDRRTLAPGCALPARRGRLRGDPALGRAPADPVGVADRAVARAATSE